MAVQDGTLRYKERYRKVQEGTSQYKNRFNCTSRYVLARTYLYCSIRLCFPAEFAAAILPGRQLCIGYQCIHSHQCKRKQDLIKSTVLGALAILGGFPRLLGGGGVGGAGGAAAADGRSTASAAGATGGSAALSSAPAWPEGGSSCTGAAFAANLRIKGLATGRPPAPVFLRMFS